MPYKIIELTLPLFGCGERRARQQLWKIMSVPKGSNKLSKASSSNINTRRECRKTFKVIGDRGRDIFANKSLYSIEQIRNTLKSRAAGALSRYQDLRFLNGVAVKKCFRYLGYRFLSADRRSAMRTKLLIRYFGKDTAVIADSGGAHSISIAAVLVELKGYQAVWKFGSLLKSNGAVSVQQELSALRYHYPLFKRFRARRNAPPVFIMDTHRDDFPTKGQILNGVKYTAKDFPSAQALKKRGIKKVIWITEGKDDSKPVLMSEQRLIELRRYLDIGKLFSVYSRSGLKVYQLKINPFRSSIPKRFKPGKYLKNWVE